MSATATAGHAPAHLQTVLGRLEKVTPAGDGYRACCPAHDDRNPSLSVGLGDDNKVLLRCHAGCAAAEVVSALGLSMSNLYPPEPEVRFARRRRPRAANGTLSHSSGSDQAERAGKVYQTANAAVAALTKLMGGKPQCWRYHDADNKPVGLVCRWDTEKDGEVKKHIRPVSKFPDGWRVKAMPSPQPLYNLSQLAAAEAVAVCEGEKCADLLARLGYTATTSSGGSQAARFTDWSPLAGKTVAIFPDNDEPGRRYAAEVAGILSALERPAVVKVVELPGLAEGGDIDDFIATRAGLVDADLRAELDTLIGAADLAPVAPVDTRVEIPVSAAEYKVNAASLAALALDPELFHRAGRLVMLSSDGRACEIVGVPVPVVRDRLSRLARYTRLKADSVAEAHPPDWSVSYAASAPAYPGLRRLEGVVNFPVLSPSGLILGSGYDPETGLYVAPCGVELRVPTRPTQVDGAAAAARILDLVGDFPFKSAAHKAAWLAALLTPLARPAFDGPAPLVLIDANAPGTGKTLLADIIHGALTGSTFGVTPYPDDGEELNKCIVSFALSGRRLVCFDNLAGRIGGAILDGALTTTTWEGRKLGKNQSPSLPLHVTFFATGNNVQVRADCARRTLQIKLSTPHESPDTRDDFRVKDLFGYVVANRAALLSDAFTVLVAYCRAGRPDQGLSAWGKYEAWSELVRGAVVFAGLTDPAATRAELRAHSDRDGEVMAAVIAAVKSLDPASRGMTAADLVRAAAGRPDDHAALQELAGPKPLDAGTLAYRLRGFDGRNFGGWCVAKVGARNKLALWAARQVGAPTGRMGG